MSDKRTISDFFKIKPSVLSANLLKISETTETVCAEANECGNDKIVESSCFNPKKRKAQEDDAVQDVLTLNDNENDNIFESDT